ncbi:hypothetical protein DFQ02_1089 [Seonamhaeicola aphaedonensis]|uniref:Uncharacterized protein n=1 Tax=Seonamhaeicola aphaedonensis TaxID=1461338 RepID=A0A3D9H8Y9_9FLAO|nr:hypothetical protein DFQ02_1089 [Seonamhaeicola aphaedonensis]
MNRKKKWIILFGIICILLGFDTDNTNFIPSSYKYITGGIFIVYGLFFVKNTSKSNDLN